MGNAFELLLKRLDVVEVDVRVSHTVNEFSTLQSANLGQHAGQKRVGGDVEWNSESNITAALVHLATQFAIRHIELCHNVAGWKGHQRLGCWVPG